MLDALDRTLGRLLESEMPLVAERVDSDSFDTSFELPNREFSAGLTRPTLNLFLYNIQENRERGRSPWVLSRDGDTGETRRPPVRLDCAYLVTAWSNEVQDEHRMLAAAARVFFRNTIVSPEQLDDEIPHEFEIVSEVALPADIRDIVELWGVLDNDMRPSLRVTVTVPLELGVAHQAPLVGERGINYDPPAGSFHTPKAVRMSGRLLRDGDPVAGAVIRIERASARTRDDGSFEIVGVRPGPHTAHVIADHEFFQVPTDVPSEAQSIVELDLVMAAAPTPSEVTE